MREEERQLERLKQWVLKHGGLDCQFYKANYLKRRLAVRMRATGSMTYQEYLALLDRDPGEFDQFLDRLTINVSHFFRDPTVFRTLNRLVLPELAQRPRVFIWSAGCANGEEPYSLAMLCADYQPKFPPFRILATDIDPTVLARAQVGVYKDSSITEVSHRLRQNYLERQEGGWAVKPDLKTWIQFMRQDLTGKLAIGPFDLIVCRNVLIYFNRQLQERLMRDFHRLLTPQGFLVLGKTEVLLAECRPLYKILDVGERIYQRKSAAG